MDRTVKSVEGLTSALRDLINKAGDGDLLGGRLTGAIADESRTNDRAALTITIDRQRYVVMLYPTVGLHETEAS